MLCLICSCTSWISVLVTAFFRLSYIKHFYLNTPASFMPSQTSMNSEVSRTSNVFSKTDEKKYLLSLKLLFMKFQIHVMVLVKLLVPTDQFFFLLPAHLGRMHGPLHEATIRLLPHPPCHLNRFNLVRRNESTDQGLRYCGNSKVIGNSNNIF